MANRLKFNPLYFDQFDTDTTLAEHGHAFIVKKIRWKSVADGDIFRLKTLMMKYCLKIFRHQMVIGEK